MSVVSAHFTYADQQAQNGSFSGSDKAIGPLCICLFGRYLSNDITFHVEIFRGLV